MAAYPNPENPAADERRAMPRAETRRAATFGAASDGAFRRGTVVDLSPNGLRIETQYPLDCGLQIEIELAPHEDLDGEQPMLVRGEVVRVEAMGSATSHMGIQLRVRLPESAAAPSLANRAQAEALLRQLATDLKAPAPDSGRADEWSTTAERAVAGVRFREPPPEPDRRARKIGVALVAGLFLLLLLVSAVGLLTGRDRARSLLDGQGSSSAWRYDFTGNGTPTPAAAATVRDLAISIESTAFRLDAAARLLNAAYPEEAIDLYRETAASSDATIVERTIAGLGIVEARATTGQSIEAHAALDALPEEVGALPAVWRAVVADWGTALATDTPTPQRMQRRLDLHETINELAETPAEGVRIEVSTSEYLLRLVDGDAVIATYPVGLGFGDATPLGTFTIANMIENPDWYNRGNVVKAGDPDNPLGDYWMGLGEGGDATSYGIHPTDEAESIGKNQSRGCIRMRPADAAEVFSSCQVGTPVTIAP